MAETTSGHASSGSGRGSDSLSSGRELVALLKQTVTEWSNDDVPRLGASLAFYSAFSLAPLLVIVTAVAGLVFGDEAVRGQLSAQLTGLLGPEGAAFVQATVQKASEPGTSLAATAIGIVTLLLGSSAVFAELQSALNRIWAAPPNPNRGWRDLLRVRFVSFTMVLGIGFLLLVSLVLSSVLAALGEFWSAWLPVPAFVLEVLNFLVSFGVVTLLFAMIYKVLPDVKIDWNDVWIGAAVTSLLFSIGKLAIGFYLGRSSIASTYGAAGSLAVLLMWLYYSSQILFFGAEFTEVYARRHGSRAKRAVPERLATASSR